MTHRIERSFSGSDAPSSSAPSSRLTSFRSVRSTSAADATSRRIPLVPCGPARGKRAEERESARTTRPRGGHHMRDAIKLYVDAAQSLTDIPRERAERIARLLAGNGLIDSGQI